RLHLLWIEAKQSRNPQKHGSRAFAGSRGSRCIQNLRGKIILLAFVGSCVLWLVAPQYLGFSAWGGHLNPELCGLQGRKNLTSCGRSEEHTSELQSRENLVCRLLLEK